MRRRRSVVVYSETAFPGSIAAVSVSTRSGPDISLIRGCGCESVKYPGGVVEMRAIVRVRDRVSQGEASPGDSRLRVLLGQNGEGTSLVGVA